MLRECSRNFQLWNKCQPHTLHLRVLNPLKFFKPSKNFLIVIKLCVHMCASQRAFAVIQFMSHVRLFATPWTAALQASLSLTSSQSLLRLMSIESVMPSNHLILCRPLLLLPSIFPSIRVFSISQLVTSDG